MTSELQSFACPLPHLHADRVLLAHGGGGRQMHRLLQSVFFPAFGASNHDGFVWPQAAARLAFTTDAYVVKPLFFPGGNIGLLAVHGTINDLAMCGARPLHLSASFILEEGLAIADLRKVVQSMAESCFAAGVSIVCGDTKVVERGRCDGIYLSCSGIGVATAAAPIGPTSIQMGDAVILSGDLGRHGVAIMATREGLELETALESDTADLSPLVLDLIRANVAVHCLRDLTRGGLATALSELAEASQLSIEIEEALIPVESQVRAVCELLGLEPTVLANEGRFVCILPEGDCARALACLRSHSLGAGARRIGRVTGRHPGMVTIRNDLGVERIMEMPSGELLPRIC